MPTARGEPAHRVEHERPRDRDHRAVDPFGQLVDRVIDLEALQLVALGVHRIDVAFELVLDEVVEEGCPQGPDAVRGADHGDALGPQQAVDLLIGEALCGHAILLPLRAVRCQIGRDESRRKPSPVRGRVGWRYPTPAG